MEVRFLAILPNTCSRFLSLVVFFLNFYLFLDLFGPVVSGRTYSFIRVLPRKKLKRGGGFVIKGYLWFF